MSIILKEVSKSYGKHIALECVNLEVRKGVVLGLLGPNGAGKSTMMKIITGILNPNSGVASVCQYPSHTLQARKKIGYLPEHNPLYPDMYVREYLSYVAAIYRSDKQTLERAIRRVRLTDHAEKKIRQLSKGYRQRVGLAQAIIHDPEVLILDEPTTGLDPNQLMEIRDVIKDMGKEKTLLLSTHIMQEVQHMCSDVAIIHKGKIVMQSKVSELGAQQNAQFVIRFGSGFEKDKLLRFSKDKNLMLDFLKEKNAWQVSSQAHQNARKLIVDFAHENDIEILAMENKQTDMESIFRELTR